MYIYEKHKTPCSDRIACFLSKHRCSIFSTCLSESDGEGQTTCRGAPADLSIVTVLKSVLTVIKVYVTPSSRTNLLTTSCNLYIFYSDKYTIMIYIL